MPTRNRSLLCAACLTVVVTGCRNESETTPAPASNGAEVDAEDPEPDTALVPAALGTVMPVHAFGDIWLSGQPAPEDFEAVKAAGIRTVVNQRPEAELRGFDERAAVTELGMAYANPGWNGPDQMTDAIIEETLDILRTAERPMLMHCASANRTGAIWLIYRVLDGGVTIDAAVAEAKAVGLRTPQYEAIARAYLERQE